MEKIKEFLNINSPISSSGEGTGYGIGYGSGDGTGDGTGYGSGYGTGTGYGTGYGLGSSSGSGLGSGYGTGSCEGECEGISSINGYIVHIVDGIQTIILTVKSNVALGYILNKDLTITKCYIAKLDNYFAHGKSIKEALDSVNIKVNQNRHIEKRIEDFTRIFKKGIKYSAKKFYEWHRILTGSCKLGCDNFMENKGITFKDRFTISEFVELTKNEYGGDVIKKVLG